ncbi:PucR family transcriptional regulator [Geodermatophilus sp. DF01-2]|uniref:PucR family transcriptional regulator n=1 Tax=Geodermatophilus sp. DF01-2 TaxID=2559610 RepID=UPI0010741B15|nr:helix-turn-helix domain-containing protein [Geodermatophilus sp. DF01_2]TFV62200.1 PucR family transcriptional regulator [Geodermatophilus sp. DF01_2]
MSSLSPVLSPSPPPPPPDLVQAVYRRLGEAVRRMLTGFVEEIPFYRRLPEEQLRGEIAQVCRDNMAAFVRCCREDRLPAHGELTAASAGAARRAEEGVPLDAVLMAYVIGNRVTWQMLVEQVPRGCEAQVAGFTEYLQRYLQAMLQAVTEAYMEERRSIEHHEGSAWRSLVQDVLDGRTPAALAQRLGVVIAEAYLVVSLHVGATDDERDEAVDPEVAGRRKVRRVQAVVDRLPGRAATLSSLSPAGGLVLLPGTATHLPGPAETAQVVQLLGRAAGAQPTAVAVPATSLTALPAAAGQARELLHLVRLLGRPAGLYSSDDLVLEHQYAQPGPARERLAALLEPLTAHPELLTTARCWLAHERSRRDTAEALHVHPNTLDKRLDRIVALTGVQLSTSRGVGLLQAGLVALQMQQVDGGTLPGLEV